MPSILYVSQATPLPARRRTWQQARALADSGWNVRVLCPRRANALGQEVLDGVRIVRFAQPFEGRSKAGLLLEYAIAAAVITYALFRQLLLERVDVIQVVNPPDWLALPSMVVRPFGTKLVFDMADLSPRLYQAKFGRRDGFYHALCAINREVLRRADLVVTANDAYRRIAATVGRRGKKPSVAVYSYPERVLSRPARRAPGRLRIGYLGILGPQDGVEALLEAVSVLQTRKGLPAFELQIVGDGPEMVRLQEMSRQLGVQQTVDFRGFLEGEAREDALAGFDIAVACDPINRFTQRISLNKIFAYAGRGLPILATPLAGTRQLMGDAAFYVTDDTPEDLAAGLETLLRSKTLRRNFARLARERALSRFDWDSEAAVYVAALEGLVSPLPISID